MKKMKNTKKLAGAIAALAVASALATGTTYAWFASNGSVTISSFEMEVTTKDSNTLSVAAVPAGGAYDSLQDSATTPAVFKQELTSEDIWKAILGLANSADDVTGNLGEYSDIALDALTTTSKVEKAGTNDTKDSEGKVVSGAKTYEGNLDSETKGRITLYQNDKNTNGAGLTAATVSTYKAASSATSGSTATKATGSYITFDLIFKNSSATNLVLWSEKNTSGEETASYVGEVSRTNPAAIVNPLGTESEKYGAEITKGETFTDHAANAIRVGFTNIEVGSSLTKNYSEGESKFWCPNEYFTNGAQYDGSNTTAGTTSGREKGYYKNNLASDFNYYYGAYSNYVSTVNALPNPLTLATSTTTKNGVASGDTSVLATFAASSSGSTTATSAGTYYIATTVVIWIEGTDGDCFDEILGDTISCALQFRTVATSSGS